MRSFASVNSVQQVIMEVSMECLPEEIVSEITEFLSPEDLLSCSGVCISWRSIFNKDHIWKKVYNICFPMSDPSELEDRPSVVNGGFKIPDENDLEDLCEWRVNCMREVFLRNNWAKGCYQNSSRVIDIHCFDDNSVSCDEEFLVINSKYYDLNNDMALVNFTELKNCNWDYIRFYRNKIFVKKKRKIRTYTMNSKRILFLEVEFDFDKSERNHKPINWQAPVYFLFFKQFFVGSVKGSNFFHIWDLENIQKIAEQPLPLLGCEIEKVVYGFENGSIYIQVDLTSSYLKKGKICSRKLFAFELNKQQFREIDIDMDYNHIYYSKNYILTIEDDTKFTVWSDTGQLENIIRTPLREGSCMFLYPYVTLAGSSDGKVDVHNCLDALVHKSIRIVNMGRIQFSSTPELSNIALFMVYHSDKLALLFYNLKTDTTVFELSTDKNYSLLYHSKIKLVFLCYDTGSIECFHFW